MEIARKNWNEHRISEVNMLGKLTKEGTYVGIKLANKAREVVVLEVIGQQIPGEIRRLPHHKRRAFLIPRYHLVAAPILHQLIRLRQKRRRNRPLRHLRALPRPPTHPPN